MQYIQKQIEIDTSGHINECWMIDYTRYPVTVQGHNRTATLVGYRTYSDMLSGKHPSDTRTITVLGSEVGALTGVDIQNIPNFYEVLTTKETTETYYEDELDEEGAFIGSIEKTRQVPAYPDFFGGEIINVL